MSPSSYLNQIIDGNPSMLSLAVAARRVAAVLNLTGSWRDSNHKVATATCRKTSSNDSTRMTTSACTSRVKRVSVILLVLPAAVPARSAGQQHQARLAPIAFVQGVDRICLLYSDG